MVLPIGLLSYSSPGNLLPLIEWYGNVPDRDGNAIISLYPTTLDLRLWFTAAYFRDRCHFSANTTPVLGLYY